MDRPEFTRTFVRVGYARRPVDEAVERIVRREPDMTADHVAELMFPARMYRPGYLIGEVDAWLDGIQVAMGGRPNAAPALEPGPDDGRPVLSQAASDRVQAALIIGVVLSAAVWIYVSRF